MAVEGACEERGDRGGGEEVHQLPAHAETGQLFAIALPSVVRSGVTPVTAW
jgi:hypothetical protein